MTFLAGGRLWLLIIPIAILVAYVVAQLTRRHTAARFTNVDLLARVAPKRPGWRRHLPAAALLVALVALTVGWARPAVEHRVPTDRATIILAMDVSGSMDATDVMPSRLAAAQSAATEFAQKLPSAARLALVAFAGNAQVLVSPTLQRDPFIRAVQTLQIQQSTGIGEAIYTSLGAIAADLAAGAEGAPSTSVVSPDGKPAAAIILMSDGDTNVGRPNTDAAEAAKAAGVPVSTIAYGTDEGVVATATGYVRVPVNREALREIADTTGGAFYEAATGAKLAEVYNQLGRALTTETRLDEVTAWFTGIGLVLVSLAAAAALIWTSRLV